MIGITVGVGGHLAMAEKAAELFTRATGLECVILSDEHMEATGCRHPYNMRFHTYDFVGDERVVYFDADLFFLRPWDPAAVVPDGTFGVVEDLVYASHIVDDCIKNQGTASKGYFNSGLFVMGPEHKDLMVAAKNLSEKIYFGSTPFCDQTALNVAVKALGVPLTYLDRRYNWTQTARACVEAGYPIIGMHKPHAGCSAREQMTIWRSTGLLDVQSEFEVHDEDFTDYADAYVYERVGHDKRGMNFLPDGTMGYGMREMELWWMPYRKGDERGIIIRGHMAGDVRNENEICRCVQVDDDTFEGAWTMFERMPIKLHRGQMHAPRMPHTGPGRHRAQVLKDLVTDVLAMEDPEIAEIGVFEAETSEYLLRELPNARMVLVDTWGAFGVSNAYKESGDKAATRSTLKTKRNAMRRVSFAGSRVRVIPDTSKMARVHCAGAKFDLVFIDAEHTYGAVKADIGRWRPLVRKGGILAGHDYDYPTNAGEKFGPEVKRAVDEFVRAEGLELHVEDDYLWWVRL